MNRAARFFTIFLLLFFCLQFLGIVNLPSVFAQDSTPTPPPTSTQSRAPEPPSAENWDGGKQMVYFGEGVINLIMCWSIARPYNTDGCPVTVVSEGKNETQVVYNGEGGGLVGSGSRMMAMMYVSPPASGMQYVARAIDTKFGLEPQSAYAQVSGSGAQVIKPVEILWQLSRNIAYILFIFIFLAIGFMIMFRQKLNPQTVITVQNALPGLVVGLILVTFSYFIAGLIVDLAFVLSQFLGVLLLSQVNFPVGTGTAVQYVRTALENQNVLSLFWSYIIDPRILTDTGSVGNVIYETIDQSSFQYIFHLLVGFAMCWNPIATAAIDAGASFAPIGQGFVGFSGRAACTAIAAGASTSGLGNTIINGVILVILVLALLVALARLFFSLISSYIMIMILTIFGPIMILFSVIPGNGALLSSWWRQLLANTLVFPAVFGLFMLVTTILNLPNQNTYGSALPLLGGFPSTFMQLILAYGLLLASPAVPGFVKDMLKAKSETVFGKQISANVKTGSAGASILGTLGTTVGYKYIGGFAQGSGRLSQFPILGPYIRKVASNLGTPKYGNFRDPTAKK